MTKILLPAAILGLGLALSACTQRQTAISELLTIEGVTVGSTQAVVLASVKAFAGAGACNCETDCGADGTLARPADLRLVSLKSNDGGCILGGYAISDNAAKALADGTHKAVVNVFDLDPQQIIGRYTLDRYRVRKQEDRGVAYCIPFAGPFDGLGVDQLPARIVAYRFAFEGEKLRSLSVELRGQCPDAPFPDEF